VPETYTNTSPDPLKEVAAEAIGKDGMKIDREMYRQRFASQAQEAAAAHPDLREAVASENWPAAESIVARLLMNKPTEFWNLLKLQEIFRSDRTPSLREILQVIFGLLPGVATREQVAGEHFERYLATQPVDATKLRESRQVFLAYVLDGMARALRPGGRIAVSAFSSYFQIRWLEDIDTFDADAGVNHESAPLRAPDGTETNRDLWTTCFTPRELRLLADRAGLQVDAVWSVTPGEYARRTPEIDRPEFLLVATRPLA
jgi:hypothetical protein